LNATFVPNFDIIRDPQPVDPVLTDVVQVFDLVGLNINGYIDGKPYYGNVYFVNGIKYAGTTEKTSGTNIIVYDTQLASVQKRLDVVSTITASQREETETQEDTIESISSPSRGSYSTTPTSAPSTPSTSTPSTTPATGGGYSTPSTPAPSTPSTPSTPAPSTPSTPSGGGGGGYGGGY